MNKPIETGFSPVNGISLYYEIYGAGQPLVLIHGGGSTIQSSFEKLIPLLETEYKIIAVELQNHGRSGFREEQETFEQDADDVAALLQNLRVETPCLLGFSNGASTALQVAIRHSDRVKKVVSIAAGTKRAGYPEGFFEGMKLATIENMPQELQDAFLKVNPDRSKLQIMFERDRDRMINFADWPEEQIKSISAPVLLVNGDRDVITMEHTSEMFHLIPNCRLLVLPGTHGEYLGQLEGSPLAESSLAALVSQVKLFLAGKMR